MGQASGFQSLCNVLESWQKCMSCDEGSWTFRFGNVDIEGFLSVAVADEGTVHGDMDVFCPCSRQTWGDVFGFGRLAAVSPFHGALLCS